MSTGARAFIATGLAAAVLGLATTAPAQENMVRIGTDVDAATLDPRLMRDTTAYRVVNMLFDGLVQLGANLTPVPDLAESWENPDATTWIFHLRDGVTFHDGQPVTAEDVVYTLETILDPDLQARFRSLYTPISQVEAMDDRTVKITLSEPYAPLLSYLDLGIVPKHYIENGGDGAGAPIGSGPYRLKSWDKGSKIVLEANPDFWGGKPNVETVEWVVVPDNTARAQALEAGDLDIIQSPLSPQDVQRLADDDRFKNRIETGIAITYLNFNAKSPVLGDPRMRKALAMLVDQDTIVDQIYEGTDQKAQSVLLSASWAYTPEIQQPTYAPDDAKAILAELGWTDSDGDGFLDKDGQKLTIELGTHSEDPNRVQTIEYMQNVLTQNGVDAQVRISDWPSFFGRLQQGEYEVNLLGWTLLVDPDRGLFGQLHSTGGLNWGGYNNAEVDSLLEQGRLALEQPDRIAAYQQAAEIIAEEVPYYVLSYQGYQVFFDPAIEGLETNPRGMMRSLANASLAQ